MHQESPTITSGPTLRDMDAATAELLLQLQLEDLEEIDVQSKGKQKQGTVTDAQVARQLQEEELQNARTWVADSSLAQSMARAVQADGQVVAQLRQAEVVAQADHNMAMSLSGQRRAGAAQSESISAEQQLDDQLLARLATLNMHAALGEPSQFTAAAMAAEANEDDEERNQPESSAWAATRSNANHKPARDCVSCLEIKKPFDLMAAPCRHEYCQVCIVDLFTGSFTDESLFPPRCCRQTIPVSDASQFLSNEMKVIYAEKAVEFSTPNRTYCSQAACSAFITPDSIHNQTAHCPRCSTRTCTLCKGAAHVGQDCPEDPNHQAVLDLAQQEGWRACYSCHRMVELDTGCYHMTYVSFSITPVFALTER
jgi:hypothetical protein